MTTQEQDKIWNDLSEESKDRVISLYNGDTSGVGSQFAERKKCYERIFGSHNLKSRITELTVEPSPQWMKDAGKEIQQKYNLDYIDRVYITGIIARHYRINNSKK